MINMKKENKILRNELESLILDSIVEGVFTVDSHMKVTYFNKAAEKITGINRTKAVGMYCYNVLKSNICENNCPIRLSFKTGTETINKHKNILRIDGKKIPVTLNSSVLRDNKGNMIGGVETFRDLSPIVELQKEIERRYTFEDIVTKSPDILKIFDVLPNIAQSESSVLIQGPSGTGKELFARAIHNLSFRKNGPFIAINCGALPDSLIESELFGYSKGAFTDAKKEKPGRFEQAENGTLFLDEVDSLPISTQVKLLRVLQEKLYEPLGSTKSKKSNVRILSASKNNLLKLVNNDSFREDLYFRLNVVKIELPTLSARREDIPLLINHFIYKFNHKMGKHITGLSHDVLTKLMIYDYPGNVRELENIMEHCFVMCKTDEIQIYDLPLELSKIKSEVPMIFNTIQNAEKEKILEILEKNNWDRSKTAKDLGIDRTTLWRKIKKFQIE